MRRVERCRNPWNGRCRRTDIELYIVHGGKTPPICSRCWIEIAEKPVEWGELRASRSERPSAATLAVARPAEAPAHMSTVVKRQDQETRT